MCHEDAADIFNYCLNFYQKFSSKDWNGFNVLEHFQEKLVHLILDFTTKKISQVFDQSNLRWKI